MADADADGIDDADTSIISKRKPDELAFKELLQPTRLVIDTKEKLKVGVELQ